MKLKKKKKKKRERKGVAARHPMGWGEVAAGLLFFTFKKKK
jgi:hypothetical protein